MKVLVATTLTQGIDDDDYHYSVEGELVWIQEPCDRDKNDPDGPAAADEASLARRHTGRRPQRWSWSRK
jgi:hypothetical protein